MASTDRGKTSYVGVVQPLITSATAGAAPDTAHGNYSLSGTVPASGDRDRGATAQNEPGSSNLPAPPPTVFKMTGWYAAGSVYESWTSLYTPVPTPPSGHSLTNVHYVVVSGGAN
jgi:hypothetical protein